VPSATSQKALLFESCGTWNVPTTLLHSIAFNGKPLTLANCSTLDALGLPLNDILCIERLIASLACPTFPGIPGVREDFHTGSNTVGA